MFFQPSSRTKWDMKTEALRQRRECFWQTVSFETLLYGLFYLSIPKTLIVSYWVRYNSRR